MQDLKERLKTVQEMLNLANFIRIHAEPAGAAEANALEMQLNARKQELEGKIAALKPGKKKTETEPALSHAE